MSKQKRILAIDAGNTRIKAGMFVDDHLTESKIFNDHEINLLLSFADKHKADCVILSSVLSQTQTQELKSVFLTDVFTYNAGHAHALNLIYDTPETLGFDRICNAMATLASMKSTYGLSIDIGTCIKFDLVQSQNRYLGGSISPGIDLRYKSLNDYTANLPLLSSREKSDLVGRSTANSIHSGVMNGIQSEINDLIHRYESSYDGLTIFVTGGDALYFDFPTKNNIFADQNLTLRGLYAIYKTNS